MAARRTLRTLSITLGALVVMLVAVPAALAITVTKTADNATVQAGGDIGFTVTVFNDEAVGRSVQIGDVAPAGTDIAWTETTGADCQQMGNEFNCQFFLVPAGESRSIHIQSPTTVRSCGAYQNTATANNGTESPDIRSNTASVTVQCPAPPTLAIRKTADAASVSPGTAIGFTIAVTNPGPGTASSVTLTDPLPTTPGTSFSVNDNACSIANGTLTCAFGTLNANETRTIRVTSPTTGDSCGTISNTASVTQAGQQGAPPSSTATTTVACSALTLTKTADAANVTVPDQLGFTVTVGNSGNSALANVTVSDQLPGGLDYSLSPAVNGCAIASGTLTCTLASLATGASQPIHVVAPTQRSVCGPVANTAAATADGVPRVTAQATTTVNCPTLGLTKAADVARVAAGDDIGFTLVLSNTGTGEARDATLTDTLPADAGLRWRVDPAVTGCSIAGGRLTCAVGTLAPGASARMHLKSATTRRSCGEIPNTATAGASNAPAVEARATTRVACSNVGGSTGGGPPARARLRGPKRCVSGPFALVLVGSRISGVVVKIDGGTVKRFRRGDRRYRLGLDADDFSPGLHKVRARVSFRGGADDRVVRLVFQECDPSPMVPQFTG